MLIWIMLGGTVTAVYLRRNDDKSYKWTWLQLFYLFIDVSGFAVFRLALTEYEVRVGPSENMTLPMTELQVSSHHVVAENTANPLTQLQVPSPESSDKEKPNTLEARNRMVKILEEKVKREISERRKKVMKLIVSKISGNLLESLLSFSLVSYYLILGTVSDHPDVERPTPFVYLT